MEPVPGGGWGGRQRRVAVCVGDMGGAIPLEHHPAGLDVDLLDKAIDDPLVGGAADGGQVRRRDGVGREQSGVPGRDEELVEVSGVVVTSSDLGDLLVMLVVDVVGAVRAVRADSGPCASGASCVPQTRRSRCRLRGRGGLEPGKDGLPKVRLGAEVGSNLAGGQPVEPATLPVVVRISGPAGYPPRPGP